MTGSIDSLKRLEDARLLDQTLVVMTGDNDALPEGSREIDAGGRVVMPGVIDPHCHLGVNYPYNEDMRTACEPIHGKARCQSERFGKLDN